MYRKIVGSLIYATLTRPDMSHDVGVLSQFMQVPKKPHLDAAHRVLRYAESTLIYGLFYAYGVDVKVFGYNDANWAGLTYDRRSTSGYVFSFGSGAVSWSNKKQPDKTPRLWLLLHEKLTHTLTQTQGEAHSLSLSLIHRDGGRSFFVFFSLVQKRE